MCIRDRSCCGSWGGPLAGKSRRWRRISHSEPRAGARIGIWTPASQLTEPAVRMRRMADLMRC
eukprot:11457087-Prorocentrum_lima.AAC.1